MTQLAREPDALTLAFGEPSPLTPTLVRYEKLDENTLCQLSRGLSIYLDDDGDQPPIYGVTVLRLDGDRLIRYLGPVSGLFFDLEEAEAHITKLATDGIPNGSDFIAKRLPYHKENS